MPGKLRCIVPNGRRWGIYGFMFGMSSFSSFLEVVIQSLLYILVLINISPLVDKFHILHGWIVSFQGNHGDKLVLPLSHACSSSNPEFLAGVGRDRVQAGNGFGGEVVEGGVMVQL